MSPPRKPAWITWMAILCTGVALVLIVIVVVAAVIVDPVNSHGAPPSVVYVTVDAHVAAAHTGGHELVVSVELMTTSRMPHVAPHVDVAARCGTAVDQEKAFFMKLSSALPGDRKVDTVELFEVDAFAAPPERCDLTLSLSEGATPPQRYCFHAGKTTPGACL